MDPEQSDRMTWLLGNIYHDIGSQLFRYRPMSEEAFVERYMKLAASRRHETHTFISLSLEFHTGGHWKEEGVVENEFLDFLDFENPKIYLGDVNGKHSDVVVTYDEILRGKNTDYHKVVTHKDDFPNSLDGVYEENEKWKEWQMDREEERQQEEAEERETEKQLEEERESEEKRGSKRARTDAASSQER